jgi:hypothetical protein
MFRRFESCGSRIEKSQGGSSEAAEISDFGGRFNRADIDSSDFNICSSSYATVTYLYPCDDPHATMSATQQSTPGPSRTPKPAIRSCDRCRKRKARCGKYSYAFCPFSFCCLQPLPSQSMEIHASCVSRLACSVLLMPQY